MLHRFNISTITLILLSLCLVHAEDKVPLETKLPRPLFTGTPAPFKVANLERPRKGKRPVFKVPEGTINLSAGKNRNLQ